MLVYRGYLGPDIRFLLEECFHRLKEAGVGVDLDVCFSVVEARDNVPTNVDIRIWNCSPYLCYAGLLAEIHHDSKVFRTCEVHVKEPSQVRDYCKPWSQLRKQRAYELHTLLRFFTDNGATVVDYEKGSLAICNRVNHELKIEKVL